VLLRPQGLRPRARAPTCPPCYATAPWIQPLVTPLLLVGYIAGSGGRARSVCERWQLGTGMPWPTWIFMHNNNKVEGGLMVLFFGFLLFFFVAPLETFLSTPLHLPEANLETLTIFFKNNAF